MRRRPDGVLALAVVAALTCTGCVRTDAGQPWTGFLGAVEVLIGREAERGNSLFHVRQAAAVCVRFELHGDNGPRRVTFREIDCPPWSPPPPSRT